MKSLTVHHKKDLYADTQTPDPHQDTYTRTTLGFWMYLMTDCILFATLFATYAVLKNSTFGGPSSKDFFELPTAFMETLILLTSSLTSGLAILSAVKDNKKRVFMWLFATFLMGTAFIGIELNEFRHLVAQGNSWQRSGFLSAFFTLVGTHGLHVTIGLTWLIVMLFQVFYTGISVFTFRRLVLFSMFWHFLDVIWIFIFTFVYLLGVL